MLHIEYDGEVSHWPKVAGEAEPLDDNEDIRGGRQHRIARTCHSRRQVRLRVAISPSEVGILEVVRLISEVVSNHQLVVLVPGSKAGETADPHALVPPRDVPEAFLVGEEAAPAILRNVVVDNDHESSLSELRNCGVEGHLPGCPCQRRVLPDEARVDGWILVVGLSTIRKPYAVEAHLDDPNYDLGHGLHLQPPDDPLPRAIGSVPVHAGPLHPLAISVDNEASLRVKRQPILSDQHRACASLLACVVDRAIAADRSRSDEDESPEAQCHQ
mmetsp:Transcript_130754/g.279672  ORF Transcript_130754/g.279672 Transcript_130754/m.279672 type:complete len:272 (+) Transcript_130754:1324-2139(+)